MLQHAPFSVQDYRRRAAQCFRLARGAVSFEVAHMLSRLGAEYESIAERAEAESSPVRPLTAA